jgi:glycosyltransferase involved in cell wall biosynthesis
MTNKPCIVHVTSVHTSGDARVFHKQCCSIAEAGYDTHLVLAGEKDRTVNGVQIHSVPKASNRILRLLVTTLRVAQKAISLKPSVIQFHDPELIPIMLLLRAAGHKIVYDIHEDYVTSISQKEYLFKPLAKLIGKVFGAFEKASSIAFTCLLAERYYIERFPLGKQILNYPLNKMLPFADNSQTDKADNKIKVLYTGGHWFDRGGQIHANIVNLIPNLEVYLIGKCSEEWAKELNEIAGANLDKLHIEGAGYRVPYEDILSKYQQGNWTAGLAIFPDKGHHKRKELTKFYEYMAAGIPVVCSDFPVWKNLIEGEGVGLTVCPDSSEEITNAILYLINNPEKAQEMGARGRKAVIEKYNWDVEAKKLLSIYKKILEC